MAYDGIVTRAVVWELSSLLEGGRIEKVHQAERDELSFQIYSKGQNFKLVISANPENPRLHLSNHQKENPLLAPNFCMVLRKHLQAGRIISISQKGMDRIISIKVVKQNDLKDVVEKELIIEIMGRHSNIILVDEMGKIIDAIKHVDDRISSVREVLPARNYMPPPSQDKVSIEDIDFINFFDDEQERIDKLILNKISGFSPLLAKSICNHAGIDPFKRSGLLTNTEKDSLVLSLNAAQNDIVNNKYMPAIITNEKRDFHVLALTHTQEAITFNTANLMLDEFYTKEDKNNRLKSKKASLLKTINTFIDRANRKLAIHIETLEKSKSYDEKRIMGELLYANTYMLQEGEEAEVINFYEENAPLIKIKLDPNKSIVDNGKIYFHKYKKEKSAFLNAKKNIKASNEEIFYLENVKSHLENIDHADEIEEIKEELYENSYLKKYKKKKGPVKKSAPIHIKAKEGNDIYIGKNNIQNDYVTFKIGSQNDIWLHVKDFPGSHVIIKGPTTGQTIKEAAEYAAYYSKERNSNNVLVDYTKVKYVKKPKGARPGMVNYSNQKSISVNPSDHNMN